MPKTKIILSILTQKDGTIFDEDQQSAFKIITFKRLTKMQELQLGVLNHYIVTRAAKD